MSNIDRGGSAFPVNTTNAAQQGAFFPDPGMSFRDYAAVHAPEPKIEDIAAAAGVIWSDEKIWTNEHTRLSWERWWSDKTLEERGDLLAKVRFAYADAIIRARHKA